MRVILVRHGETEWVRQKRYQGKTDIGLNQNGLRQARKVAAFLRGERPDVIFCSGLKRARQTAEAIAKAAGKTRAIRIDRGLNELSFGRWEGLGHSETRDLYPAGVRKFYRASPQSRPDGGESMKAFQKRVGKFIRRLLETCGRADQTVMVVAHGGTIRMLMVHLLGIPMKLFWNFRVDPASVTILNVNSRRNEAVLLNSCLHLMD